SPEHGWIRTWLDTVVELPWGTRSDDHLQVTEARAILDADHNGLEDVKDRIVEYLAVRKLRVDRGLAASSERGPGAVLALVWAPIGGAARPRPCSRSSTQPRTTPSVTTTSRSSSTCPRCCSSPLPMWPTRFRVRSSTVWRSSVSTATPRTRSSPSLATTCSAA